MQDKDIDRFRGWALMALYASMAILGAMLVLAAFRLWPSMNDGATYMFILTACGAATIILSTRSSLDFYRKLRRGERPKLALLPFVLMVLTLFAASEMISAV
ncbi:MULTISPECIES: hypothetical protein [Kordiimonas]|jgi:membrane protease YdiL (CAAX protease family)|uniref:Uncharacterized protein n=1 Tax=Kordiimonas lacus TaxID=637679 RepID=A0A1G6ZTD5_9PROT|nr:MULTISPECIES: hypothetical protein [Kordiimonas]SDE05809.1 hypothetical protein SAMN04488071_1942 [Kordiimonas lacus]